MNILFSCHKHPVRGFDHKPRGAEISMQIIMKYLRKCGFRVTAWVQGAETETIGGVTYFGGRIERRIEKADLVITWGRPAYKTALACIERGIPYILLVRWWRNIQHLPPGNLMNRTIDKQFVEQRKIMFESASSIITNNEYSKRVIQRFYGAENSVSVSYVPIPGDAKKLADREGTLTIVTPNKELGEFILITSICNKSPRDIWIVNCPEKEFDRYLCLNNVRVSGYINNMKDVWRNTSILLCPIYYNDICGTLRVTIEAMQHGVPVIANDRSGIGEKVPNLVSRSANRDEWLKKINHVLGSYDKHSDQALEIFRNYDTIAQLEVFRKAVNKALCQA